MALQVSDPSVSVKFTCESDLAVQCRSAQPLDRAVWCFLRWACFSWHHSQKSWITVVAQDHFDCSISCVSPIVRVSP